MSQGKHWVKRSKGLIGKCSYVILSEERRMNREPLKSQFGGSRNYKSLRAKVDDFVSKLGSARKNMHTVKAITVWCSCDSLPACCTKSAGIKWFTVLVHGEQLAKSFELVVKSHYAPSESSIFLLSDLLWLFMASRRGRHL